MRIFSNAMNNGLYDILISCTYIVEIFVLMYLEYKAWKTIYTPLFFLILPFTAILLITVCISEELGFVPFYYPSLLIWCGGLLVFAIPSMIFSSLCAKAGISVNSKPKEESFPNVLVVLAAVIFIMFVYRFRQISGSTADLLGTDDFAMEFSGYGFWAHVRQLSMPILVMAIYYLDKKHWWLSFVVIASVVVNFIAQVKGWVIIPVVSGLAFRLYTGKTKLKLSLFLYVFGGAFLVFIVSYMVLPLLGNDGEVTTDLFDFVVNHFFHYLTSGVLGQSEDMVHDFPDRGGFEMLICPFVNIYNVLSGSDEMLSPVNDIYYNTGINITNVRTFFGTIYIYTDLLSFIVYVFYISTVMYILKLATVKFSNVYVYVIYFFECGLLCMGWFEFYFFHLTVIEFPILALLIMLLVKFQNKLTALYRNISK